jgi:Flp pilus assembly protein TadG
MKTVRPRSFAASEAGGALIELAVSLPLLIVIIAGTVDFARVFNMSVTLTNAARAGAQWGSYDVARSGNAAGMQTAAINSVPDLPGVTAVATRTCECATDAGVFTATVPSANNCTDPPATSCPTGHVVITVTVTTSKTFNTIMNLLPGVPASIPLTRSASLRVVN